MNINGVYLDGKTSKRINARMEVSAARPPLLCIHLLDDSYAHEPLNICYADIKIESRLGSTPRAIVLGQKQLFITPDHYAIDMLASTHPRSSWPRLLHKLENSAPLVLFSTLVTLVIIWLTLTLAIPKAVEHIAEQLPVTNANQSGDWEIDPAVISLGILLNNKNL